MKSENGGTVKTVPYIPIYRLMRETAHCVDRMKWLYKNGSSLMGWAVF